MLFQNAPAPYHTSKPLVVGVAVALGGFWAFAISKAVAGPTQTGRGRAAAIVGSVGEVRGDGLVYVNGELWQARTRAASRCARASEVAGRVPRRARLTVPER